MPNYNVRIQWTSWGASGNNNETVDERIARAIEAAGRHYVDGHGGNPLNKNQHRHDDGKNQFTWHVHAIDDANGQADAKIQALVDRWNGGSDGAGFPAFTPNVQVLEWGKE
jgi:hypothetical protein